LTQLALALNVAERRGRGIVPIWIERFALAVLAAVFVGAVILNVLKMDWIQRTGLGIGILGLSVFLAQSLYLSNKAKADADTPQQVEQKKPDVQQSSQGSNSPNTTVIGSNNVVNIGDPKVAARLDEITNLLKAQGERVSPKKLLAKYPLGYIIFDVDNTNSVFPYKTQSLRDKWEIDWSHTQVSEPDNRHISLTIPHLRQKESGLSIGSITITIPKTVPFSATILRDEPNNFSLKIEILATRPTGTVFVIGFGYAPKN
jgi:hypothetical protein